jgi:uncharacterized membrane protein
MFWGLSKLDLAALAFFIFVWLGYGPLVRQFGGRFRKAARAMIEHRRAWMYSIMGREMRVADTAAIGHIMSTTGLLASTTVIVIGALLGTLINMERSLPPVPSGAWLGLSPRDPLEVKLALVLAVAVYAFFTFTWSIRQANFASVLIGALPLPPVEEAQRAKIAAEMGNIITEVASAHDQGMRAYYFALASVTWVAGPILFIIATTAVVALLLRRQSLSKTALALKEVSLLRENKTKAKRKSGN